MRYQGTITHWKDDRGFGFITPDGGGTPVFVHISAFKKGQRRPAGDELVTYELFNDLKKGFRAQNVSFFEVVKPAVVSTKRCRTLMPFMVALIVTGSGFYAWQHLSSDNLNVLLRVKSMISESFRKLDESVKNLNVLPHAELMPRAKKATKFQCQGKRRCSEMTSCEEAIFYLENCPGVQIDGDGDGIPCESQFCGH